MNNSQVNQTIEPGPLAAHWAALLIVGLILFIFGIWAIAYSTLVSVLAVFWFGVLLLASGVLQLISIFVAKKRHGFTSHLLIALLSIIAGFWILFQPMSAAVTLLWIIAFYFFISGMIHIIFAASERKDAWYWMVLLGLVEIALAFMMWSNWPISGLWVIGLFISIHVLLTGWYLINVAFVIKRSSKNKH